VIDRALAAFPTDAVGPLVIVTSGDPVPGHPDAVLLPAGAAADLLTLSTLRGRALRPGVMGLLTTPPRWIVRRYRRWQLIRRGLGALTDRLAAATKTARPQGDGPVVVVCLGGLDVLAAAPLRASGAIVVEPGGLRRLADRRIVPSR
jgi:hypothetical protein